MLLSEYWTAEAELLDGLNPTILSGPQQPFPAMCQGQPKFSVRLIGSARCESAALLNLFLKKSVVWIIRSHHNKQPRFPGLSKLKTRLAVICSEITTPYKFISPAGLLRW
jgi:hypothetical protein